jgi:hypothetical protein
MGFIIFFNTLGEYIFKVTKSAKRAFNFYFFWQRYKKRRSDASFETVQNIGKYSPITNVLNVLEMWSFPTFITAYERLSYNIFSAVFATFLWSEISIKIWIFQNPTEL